MIIIIQQNIILLINIEINNQMKIKIINIMNMNQKNFMIEEIMIIIIKVKDIMKIKEIIEEIIMNLNHNFLILQIKKLIMMKG